MSVLARLSASLRATRLRQHCRSALATTIEIGQSGAMEAEFLQLREDGTVDARLVGDWPIFNEALADSISSIPPRGSKERRLSTYWIDGALARVSRARRSADPAKIASGNAYSILVSGEQAIAVFDYGDDDTRESMPLDDFVRLLEDWRERVTEIQRTETREVPETYRRNPWP
jgi:hypothetical protein